MTELRTHVCEELGEPDGVVVIDPSAFPKKGTESCGVGRQWCGRLGKVDNCQIGVFLAYAAARGCTLVDAQLYLPADWAADDKRRRLCHVPAAIGFQQSWRIALDLLDGARGDLPGRWVVGDDEFGRCTQLRAALRQRRLRALLDAPANNRVRRASARLAPLARGGKSRRPDFEQVQRWLLRQPAGRWRQVRVRDGEKGPLQVKVLLATVQTKDEGGRAGGTERLVVLRTCEAKPRTWYTLSNARDS